MAINQSPNELYKAIPKTTKTISPSPTMHLSTTYHTTTLAEDKTILMSLKRLIWFGAILFAVALDFTQKDGLIRPLLQLFLLQLSNWSQAVYLRFINWFLNEANVLYLK